MSAVDDFLDTPGDANGWGHNPPRRHGRVVTLGHYRRPRQVRERPNDTAWRDDVAIEDVPECAYEPKGMP